MSTAEDASTIHSGTLLEARDLSYVRDDEPVVGPLSFCLPRGAVLVVQGANGSGKTTLLRMLAGVLTPEQGTIRLNGHSLAAVAGTADAELAYLGHALGLKDDLTVEENLHFATYITLTGTAMTPRRAIDRIGLAGYRHSLIRHLSAGQRKRAALARLLLTSAPLWLIDEPYSNLDPAGRRLVDDLLADHAGAGGAAVVTSHHSIELALPIVHNLEL